MGGRALPNVLNPIGCGAAWPAGKDALCARSSQGRSNHFGASDRAIPTETRGKQGPAWSHWSSCGLAWSYCMVILGVSMRRLPLGV
jgi:hypothetical protein